VLKLIFELYSLSNILFKSASILPFIVKFSQDSGNNNSNISNTFNIGTVHNSIVGNQQNAVMNFENSITNLRDIVSQKSEDKEQLEKFANYLEALLENNDKIEKSNFEKFSDLLAKHSDIALAIGNTIFQWIIRK